MSGMTIMTVVKADRLRSANVEMLGELIEDDRSAMWFIVAESRSGEYVSIELGAERLGGCYDSLVDRHGVAGSCAVVANSVSECFERSLTASGSRHYWRADDFVPYGDAYDDAGSP
jgi:antitoxin YokJ